MNSHKSRKYHDSINTGLDELDKLTGGLKKGGLTIVAARPSVGKTTFALSVALNCVKRVGIYSLEQSKVAVTTRLLSLLSKVHLESNKNRKPKDAICKRLARAANVLNEKPIFIDDSCYDSIDKLMAEAVKSHKNNSLDLIIIDYLQLIPGAKACSSREIELKNNIRKLKSLAVKLNVSIMVLSQLSRKAEGKNPSLKDVGLIGKYADFIIAARKGELWRSLRPEFD